MLMEVDDNNIDDVHWDKPNELVHCLTIWLATVSAGNTKHINEIIAIIE